MKECSHGGCAKAVLARGLCNTHYARWRRHNIGLTRASPTFTIEERLDWWGWDEVDECHVWRGPKNVYGYGTLRINGKVNMAHRLSYERAVGKIPEGLLLRHSCDNPPCINPAHLTPGTQTENMNDARVRGRSVSGERVANAKLTWEKVREIRSLAGSTSNSELARRFGVSVSNISMVVTNKTWREPQNGAQHG